MEAFVSAVLGDIVHRSISFVMDTYGRGRQSAVEENLQSLRRVLQRMETIAEEAEGRQITNRGMLRQLQMLMEGTYHGYYMLDNFRYRDNQYEVSQSHCTFALSRFNPTKRLFFTVSSAQGMESGTGRLKELNQMLHSLESMVAGMNEFVVFLLSYPRMNRQPYSSYLILNNCMFGRQAEMEQIISFLLQTEANCEENLGVLPIFGGPIVGKSTLVEHVCHDDRVRNHFSSIVFLSGSDLEDEMLNAQGVYGLTKHWNRASYKSSLVILELAEDDVLDEGRWRRLCSSSSCKEHGSRIIITSRSEKIKSFGTVQAIRLKFLYQEAYWYFFRVIAFGSANPEEYPKLASIALEIAEELRGNLMAANIVGSLLRANLDAQFWCWILESFREHREMHHILFGKHPHDLYQNNRPTYLWVLAEGSKLYLCDNAYQTRSAHHEVPKINLQQVMFGRVKPDGRFKVLAWRSQIPPYYNYMLSCSVQKQPCKLIKKKRTWQQVI